MCFCHVLLDCSRRLTLMFLSKRYFTEKYMYFSVKYLLLKNINVNRLEQSSNTWQKHIHQCRYNKRTRDKCIAGIVQGSAFDIVSRNSKFLSAQFSFLNWLNYLNCFNLFTLTNSYKLSSREKLGLITPISSIVSICSVWQILLN